MRVLAPPRSALGAAAAALWTVVVVAVTPHHHHRESTAVKVRWAGTLTIPGGIANAVPVNLTVSLFSAGARECAAEARWVMDRNNAGQRCVAQDETELRWRASGTDGRSVTVQAPGTGENFYSLVGTLDESGSKFTGDVMARGGRKKGSFALVRGAPQVPSSCVAPPPPPPPSPHPPLPVPTASTNSTVWPMPAVFERSGAGALWVDATPGSFNFTVEGGGAPFPALASAFSRFAAVCFGSHRAGPPPAGSGAPLRTLTVAVADVTAKLALGVDESYNLTLGADGSAGATLRAATVFGAMHGLETFSQLLRFDHAAGAFKIQGVPLRVCDAPRFAWRELMVDTARHFLPLKVLRGVVDSMTTAKLNVLHLHLVDSQSFPLSLPSAPALVEGAYSASERYTLADLGALQRYAEDRGIRVVAEIDTPGHGAAWCAGAPGICPSASCLQPLDPTTNATFDTIGAVLKDLFTVFPDAYVHLGGDEVDTTCWSKTPRVSAWMAKRGFSPDDAYRYFVTRTQAIARGMGRTSIVWDEIWNAFGTRLDRETTVINTRFNPGQAPARTPCVANATSHGYRVVRSQNIHWYLDQTTHKPWTAQYDFEPCGDIPDSSCRFVVGGAASMWGETVDTSDLMQTVWPRAGAVGERLWSPRGVNDSSAALPRYVAFRCYLNRRGFAAAPALNADARAAPHGPGSCFAQ